MTVGHSCNVLLRSYYMYTNRIIESSFSFNNNIAGASCTGGDHLPMNSKCYRKFDQQRTWFSASNDCLVRGGSLAVFTNIGHPSRNSQLTQWLNEDKAYWIGLIRSWWKTTNEGRFNNLLEIWCDFSCCFSLYISAFA